jgi:hypothetical protein
MLACCEVSKQPPGSTETYTNAHVADDVTNQNGEVFRFIEGWEK